MITSFPLILVDVDENLSVNDQAIDFLKQSNDSLTIFSFHGTNESGKSNLLVEILQAKATEGNNELTQVDSPPSDFMGVWMYVEETIYAHAKRILYLDVYDHGDNEGLDAMLFGITSLMSSNVIQCSKGQITEKTFESLSFLQPAVDVLGEAAALPGLTWIIRELSTKDVKAIVNSADPSADLDQLYLQAVLNAKTSPFRDSLSWQILTSFFSKRSACILPLTTSPAYPKKLQRFLKTLVETSQPKSIHGVDLHGSLFSYLLNMLCNGPRSHIHEVLEKNWTSVLHSDLLNAIEIALEKFKHTFDTELTGSMELPCDVERLKALYTTAKAEAAPLLSRVNALGGPNAQLANALFNELAEKHLTKWTDENDLRSKIQCMAILQSLHTDVERDTLAKLQPSEPLRFSDFKSILRFYQHQIQSMVVKYATEAQGPQKMAVLSSFYSSLMPQYLDYLIQMGEQTMNGQTRQMEAIKNSQKVVQEKLVQNAHKENTLRTMLQDALDGVTDFHEKAKLEGSALEIQAFNNVERTAERVMEVSQAIKSDEGVLEGYLIKQGGGGVFGRKNWKQRYFLLHRNILSYAKTKDDYERGKVLKEFSIVGCEIKESTDAGEGFEVWPPSTGQAVYDYKQGLFGSDPTLGRRKVDGDSDRIFYLRASTMEVKEQWVERLRRAVKEANAQ